MRLPLDFRVRLPLLPVLGNRENLTKIFCLQSCTIAILFSSLKAAIPSCAIEAVTRLLVPRSMEDFQVCQKALTEQKREFDTFALPEERELKIVNAEIPHSTSPDSIKEELESEGYTPISISPLTTKNHNASELVRHKSSPVNSTPTAVRSSARFQLPSQCFNCQLYGN